MKNYDDMSDFEINQLVASLVTDGDVIEAHEMATGPSKNSVQVIYKVGIHGEFYDYCNNPSDAWPIIVENEMSIWAVSEADYEIGMSYSTGDWKAYCVSSIDGESNVADDGFEATDQNPLRAAMICFLKMKDSES